MQRSTLLAAIAVTALCLPTAPTTAVAEEAASETAVVTYERPGFATRLYKERLWIFEPGSEALAAFDTSARPPAVHVVRPLAGPGGITVCSPDGELILRYLTTKPGFVSRIRKERLWVFPEGAPALAEFDAGRVPARHVVRPLAGPLGLTVMAEEAEILDAYLAL